MTFLVLIEILELALKYLSVNDVLKEYKDMKEATKNPRGINPDNIKTWLLYKNKYYERRYSVLDV